MDARQLVFGAGRTLAGAALVAVGVVAGCGLGLLGAGISGNRPGVVGTLVDVVIGLVVFGAAPIALGLGLLWDAFTRQPPAPASPARLREARVEAGLTEEELALAAGCSVSVIQSYERGARNLRQHHLRRIAHATRKPVAWFSPEEGNTFLPR